MPYVSARYGPPYNPMFYTPEQIETMPKQVVATDENGVDWHMTEDSQVGDWLTYIEEGGAIDPYVAPTNQNITSAPDTLFGGPTIAQVLGEKS